MLNKKIFDSHNITSPVHAMHNLSYAHVKDALCSEKQSGQQETEKKVRIGILALQGAFSEHCIAIHKCGAIPVEIRQEKDLENIQGLILPGGESTVMVKLLCEEGLLEPLKSLCQRGIPILATCAGLILLAKEIQSHPEQARLGLMDIVVERNAFGRQKESFIADIPIKTPINMQEFSANNPSSIEQNLIPTEQTLPTDNYIFPAVFIRAPQILSTKNNVSILAKEGEKILAVQQDNMVACSFHPELSHDLLFHTWLINEAKKNIND